tara:strand:+ start:1171 stop:2193 length:1023 start_codon:yes stop_codon:yes gene_type:complete
MSKLNILVAGSTGYIGVQLINLLVKHNKIKIKYLCGNSSIGKDISFYDKSLKNKKLPKIIKFNKNLLKDVDIIFTALPNTEAQTISKSLLKKNILIDLAADFRLEKSSNYLKWYKVKHKAPDLIKKSIYSLPEITGDKIKKFQIIACPGCYPTSILIPLIPLVKKKIIKLNNIIIDAKSGYSGAGRSVHKKFLNKNLYESLSAYGIGFHRHNSEIEQMIKKYTNQKFNISFTPHLSPMFRGIMSTIYVDLNKKKRISSLYNELVNFYRNSKFIKIKKINKMISTNDVINSNNCIISVCKSRYNNKAIILSSLDNLIKGGAGQAIQNMNILKNFNEKEGLQ